MKETNKKNETRRDILKKTGLFAVPTVASFKLSKLAVAASGGDDTEVNSFTAWNPTPDI